jgi:hypothetical protein
MYHTRGTQNTRKTMIYVCRSWLYARLTVPTHSSLLGVRQTTRGCRLPPTVICTTYKVHSAITFRRSLPTIQWQINKLAVHDYMQLLPALLLHSTPIYLGTTTHFVTAYLFRVHVLLNATVHWFRHSNVSRSYFPITLHCSRLHCWLGSGGSSNNLPQFFTDCFQIFTQRSIQIRACFYTHRDMFIWRGSGLS